jgi:hypothetical protein
MYDLREDLYADKMQKKIERIRQRHFAVDILASAAGGALVSAIVQKSWLCGVLTVVLAAGVYVFDRIGIENEESIEN